MKSKTINIVIPIFNEEDNISPLFQEIKKHLPDKYNFIFTFVNDGSKDESLNKLKKLKSDFDNVEIISFTRNFGHQSAVFAGVRQSQADAVITMDSDFQDPPELIPKFIEEWEKGFLVVNGCRIIRKHDNWFKRISAKWFYNLISSRSPFDIPHNVGDFRLIDKCVADEISELPLEAHYLRGIIAWMGFKSKVVNYDRPARYRGKTKYTFSKMFNLALNGLFSFSKIPLKFGLILGLLSVLTGFGFIFYMGIDSIANGVVYPLFKWIVVVIMIFLGFLFILIWIIGEYIARIYYNNRNRPSYIIDKSNSYEAT